jgi:hypothetical protein
MSHFTKEVCIMHKVFLIAILALVLSSSARGQTVQINSANDRVALLIGRLAMDNEAKADLVALLQRQLAEERERNKPKPEAAPKE